MSTAHVLLGLLASGPMHGYELKRSHDQRLPRAKPLAFGQVYATLGRLQRDGLVTTAGQDQEGGPERTSFGPITPRGGTYFVVTACLSDGSETDPSNEAFRRGSANC